MYIYILSFKEKQKIMWGEKKQIAKECSKSLMKFCMKHETVCIGHEYIGSNLGKCALDSDHIHTRCCSGEGEAKGRVGEGSGRNFPFVLALHFVKSTIPKANPAAG